MRPIARGLLLAAVLALSAGSAHAQRSRAAYPDDSVVAREALVRVRELADAGNTPEALRVLQSVLENESERLLPSAWDADVFVPVRRIVHETLLEAPELLARYLEIEGPKAARLLDEGDLVGVERTRLLTPAGFEAALRLAQLELEAARFESARLMLEQVERHPQRAGRGGADAARLAAEIARYIPRPAVTEWARRWTGDADLPPPAPTPPAAAASSRSTLDAGPALDTERLPAQPLQTVTITPGEPDTDRGGPRPPWVLPVLLDDLVYTSDGERLSAWDATTLAAVWSNTIARAAPPVESDMYYGMGAMNAGGVEDVAAPAAAQGVVVVASGVPQYGGRRGDGRLHAFAARTGRAMWSVDLGVLDPRVRDAALRGPPVIDGDVVVAALRDQAVALRISKLYLVGLDLHTGRPRWLRLVGSVGTNPFGRTPARPEAMALGDGLVYRSDDIGVIGAYEAASGRPAWVRLCGQNRGIDATSYRISPPLPPHDITAPVLDGEWMYVVEPGRGRVVKLARRDGTLVAARDASALAEPRYLLKVGDYLACVGPTRVAFVKADDLVEGTVHLAPSFGSMPVAGRAVIAGGKVVMPLMGRLMLIDPASPATAAVKTTGHTGNAVIVGAEDDTHLLVAATRELHSYARWEQAAALLDRRIAQSPRDPAPVLTYIELLHRSGRGERVPALADQALTLLDSTPGPDGAAAHRQRLFALLLGMVRDGHAPAEGSPLRDPALLESIDQRVARAAQAPEELAAHLIERAWLRETQGRHGDAVAAYQQILLDSSLGETVITGLAQSGPALGANDGTAWDQARTRLSVLLKARGAAAYAAYDEEASAVLADLPASAPPQRLRQVARGYPTSAAAPELWRRAAEGFARAGDQDDARRAAGAGLTAAELSADIGRPDQDAVIARLAAALLELCDNPTDAESAYRTLVRLTREHPAVAIATADGTSTPDAAAKALSVKLRAAGSSPHVGVRIATSQVIEGWEPVAPMFQRLAGASTSSVVMLSSGTAQMALWAVAAEDGLLHPLWTRPAAIAPEVVRVTPDVTLLYWGGPKGGSVEAVGIDGVTRWRTIEFATLFDRQSDPTQRISTPLDGQVGGDDILISVDDATLAMVQRSGAAACFDLVTGAALWHAQAAPTRVFELAHIAGTLVVAGASPAPGGGLQATVVCLDPGTGAVRGRLGAGEIGDHPRWVRAAGTDAVMGTGDGVVKFDPATGHVRWSNTNERLRSTVAGWAVGQGLFVLDSDLRVLNMDMKDGRLAAAAVDTRDRVTLPLYPVIMDGALALCSSQGVVVLDERGALMGVDALDSNRLEAPVAGAGVFVTLEAADRDLAGAEPGGIARLFVLAAPGARIIADERVRLFDYPSSFTLLDGKILIGQELATIVLDARP